MSGCGGDWNRKRDNKEERMEIKLNDNSRIYLKWFNTDRLVPDLCQPKTLRDGHSYTLCGMTTLVGDELTAFLAEVSKRQDTQE
jgi:hypothetical protein